MEFEWDDNKNKSNHKKHGIKFSEAASIWLDLHALELIDQSYLQAEDRWIRLGMSNKAQLLVVVFTDRLTKVRIISARKATKSETWSYRINRR